MRAPAAPSDLDHIPRMVGDPRLGTAYTIGYMKALAERANQEARNGP